MIAYLNPEFDNAQEERNQSKKTGLIDKNGKKIFEGDIVAYCTNTNEVPAKLMEVVGNIYDNPELLEEQE